MPIPSIPAILKDLWTLSDERELDLIAAGIAFYGFLALFPAAAAVIAIWGSFADATLIRQELELARDYLPPDAWSLISDQIEALLAAEIPGEQELQHGRRRSRTLVQRPVRPIGQQASGAEALEPSACS